MSVISRKEAGARGYFALVAKYGERRINEWRRRERRVSSKRGGAMGEK